jgi:Transposase DDE domain group 1
MKRSGSGRRVKVSADGRGVVSHAGAGLLRELAAETGLAGGVTGALIDTYRGFPLHLPGQVFTDLAVAIADGADAVSGIGVLRDRQALFGPVASMPTAWRLLDRIDEARLPRVRAAARERAWQAGAAPEAGGELRIDFDATIRSPTARSRTRRPPGRKASASIPCWPSWTGRRSRAGRRWPGCCGPAMRAATQRPTT